MTGEPRCKLAGHLSILVGLLAFWVEPALDYCAVDWSFRYDTSSTLFQRHNYDQNPRHEKRTMVIEIGYDPVKVTREDLHAWEEGQLGEIFS
ncbi:uncharacterized protein A1O5_06773 [Cladophialophora psammophila CBS 110553]|uniref:Uncharacterized protein n=1 Tax=Cladophialophora psammophila CBS 110553 TaxID=1182543 RepID=W9WNB8_9EURO|nr:uncharacterized protein A1O5_06773 [Cladophialophora psammophila CBS 110553]EXJ69702.1 hypothetical protein A1O5_06773 [Cladophialophora psammophila CBS 110553]